MNNNAGDLSALIRTAKNLLLTGRPGIGKTTIVREVLRGLKGQKVGGFYTEEIRYPDRTRLGFMIRTVDGREEILAKVGLLSSVRVGKYGVNVQGIESVINPSI